jgi:hypothetical protein
MSSLSLHNESAFKLKMEAEYSSETSVNISTLHSPTSCTAVIF